MFQECNDFFSQKDLRQSYSRWIRGKFDVSQSTFGTYALRITFDPGYLRKKVWPHPNQHHIGDQKSRMPSTFVRFWDAFAATHLVDFPYYKTKKYWEKFNGTFHDAVQRKLNKVARSCLTEGRQLRDESEGGTAGAQGPRSDLSGDRQRDASRREEERFEMPPPFSYAGPGDVAERPHGSRCSHSSRDGEGSPPATAFQEDMDVDGTGSGQASRNGRRSSAERGSSDTYFSLPGSVKSSAEASPARSRGSEASGASRLSYPINVLEGYGTENPRLNPPDLQINRAPIFIPRTRFLPSWSGNFPTPYPRDPQDNAGKDRQF